MKKARDIIDRLLPEARIIPPRPGAPVPGNPPPAQAQPRPTRRAQPQAASAARPPLASVVQTLVNTSNSVLAKAQSLPNQNDPALQASKGEIQSILNDLTDLLRRLP